MKNNRKKLNNGLIVMNKGERIAVISLLSVITVLLAFSVLRPALPFSSTEEHAFHNLDSMIALRERAASERAASERTAMENAVPSGGSTGPATSVSSNRPQRPSHSSNSGSAQNRPSDHSGSHSSISTSRARIPILDLNTADSTQLVALPQIGEVMASRIHRYRNRLGGFVSFEQLYEVRGMDSTRFATIRPYLVLESSGITKLEVNRDEFRTLLRHPYLEYEQVRAIVNHRERRGLIRNWEQLKQITGEVNPLLEHYISY